MVDRRKKGGGAGGSLAGTWPVPRPTTRSAMVVSSVSPDRCDTMTPQPCSPPHPSTHPPTIPTTPHGPRKVQARQSVSRPTGATPRRPKPAHPYPPIHPHGPHSAQAVCGHCTGTAADGGSTASRESPVLPWPDQTEGECGCLRGAETVDSGQTLRARGELAPHQSRPGSTLGPPATVTDRSQQRRARTR